MTDYKGDLSRARDKFPPPELPVEAVYRRTDIRRRNRRIRAGVTASVIALALAFALVRAFKTGSVPASPTPPPPAAANPLAPTVVGVGGTVRQVIPRLPRDAWQATLSPDGRQIAYVTRDLSVGDCGNCWPGARIVVASFDGTGSRYLTGIGPFPQAVAMPAWSPDGSKIAFVNTTRGNEDIYVMDTFGGTCAEADDEPCTGRVPGLVTRRHDDRVRQQPDPTRHLRLVRQPGDLARPIHGRHPGAAHPQPGARPGADLFAGRHADRVRAQGPHRRDACAGRRHPHDHAGLVPSVVARADHRSHSSTSPAGGAMLRTPTSPGCTPSCPLGRVMVVGPGGGAPRSLDVLVPSSLNPVSWMPAGDAVLVGRFTGSVF